MTYNQGSEHTHGNGNYNRAFIVSVTLNTLFVAIEAFYGIAANSLALLANSGHDLSDVLRFLTFALLKLS